MNVAELNEIIIISTDQKISASNNNTICIVVNNISRVIEINSIHRYHNNE